MKNSQDLLEQWTTLDDRTLIKNPMSIRLPVHLMARLNALCDVFPNRTRSDFVVDLLKAALETFEVESIPAKDFPEMRHTGATSLEYLTGTKYRQTANEHYRNLLKEHGLKNAPDLFPAKKGSKK